MSKISVNADDRYGRLTIVEELPAHKGRAQNQRRFLCQCECGGTKEVFLYALRNGHTTSCGCARGTHFHSRRLAEYEIWSKIKSRCLNPSDKSYQNYGGRGIEVCERWRTSYENFYSDMGPRPSKNHSLDRIDNSKGYFPDNCRWATRLEQGSNKRNNRLMTYKGRTMHMAAWAREIGEHPATLLRLLRRVGDEAAIAYYLESSANKVNP